MTNLLADARRLAAAGISVIPLRPGTKVPAIKWKEFQERIASDGEIAAWFGPGSTYGLGIVTGAVSGNLEMTEIEGRALPLFGDVVQLASDSGLAGLMQLVGGWLEKSPSGGLHWFYRMPEVPPGNTKVAKRKATADELAENPADRVKVLSETRGEGGYVVAAPTDYGTAGKWEIIGTGGPQAMPTLTAEQREDFHVLLGTMGEQDAVPEPGSGAPVTVFSAPTGPGPNGIFDGLRPGDDFNQRESWDQILPAAGWTKQFDFPDGGTAWLRPGKQYGALSATTGRDPEADRLYVFSTSVEGLPTLQPIDKFGYYAHMNHNGDFSAAGTALKNKGYGREPERIVQASQPAAQAPATEGNVAYLADYAPAAAPAPDADAQPATTPVYSDDANAQALVERDGHRIRYNSTAERWLLWTGVVWEQQPKGGGAVREVVKALGRDMHPTSTKGTKHKAYTLSVSGGSNTLSMAQTDARVTVTTGQLDSHGWELNTPGGIVDLRTGELLPSDPDRMHTRLTKVTPRGGFAGSRFEAFIRQTFPDEELAGFVQRLLGYSIVGEVEQEILPFAIGGGGNGKTALFEMVAGVLGDYATTSPNNFLMAQRQQQHPTEIARLSGARFVMCSEVNEEDKFDEAKVKVLCGGDRLTARFMGKDYFTFTPTHQLWLAGNHYPAVDSGGESFWRRLRIIPFSHTVPKAERVKGLAALLVREEGEIILAWLVAGAAAYAANGLQEPEGVVVATAEYAEAEDNVGRFIEDACYLAIDSPAVVNVSVSKLWEAYEAWCRSNTETPIPKRSMAGRLARHGVTGSDKTPKGTGGVRRYGGIALSTDEEEPTRVF